MEVVKKEQQEKTVVNVIPQAIRHMLSIRLLVENANVSQVNTLYAGVRTLYSIYFKLSMRNSYSSV